jgi:peptidoglycan/xylan/chitin deacetylase (PgdA/CDA1 family)
LSILFFAFEGRIWSALREVTNFGAMAIRSEFLERMIVDLRRRGIALVSLSEALKLATGTPWPFIALTFDDGYRDNYEVAYHILKKFDVPFAIFLTTGLIDRTLPMWWHVLEHVIDRNVSIEYEGVKLASRTKRAKAIAYRLTSEYFRHLDQCDVISATDALIAKNDSRLTRADAFNQALDWNMIREMAGSGLATFGGHTISHPLLRQLDRTSLVAEIGGCRHRLFEAGGIEPAYFAYPFGQTRRSAHWPRLSLKKPVSLRPSRHMRAFLDRTISSIPSICRVSCCPGKLRANGLSAPTTPDFRR